MALALYDDRLSYVHGASDVPLIGATIGDLFDRVAAQVPENEALVSCHQGVRYTYREFQALCDRFARGLMALGIRKGDRIGIWATNHAEWVVAAVRDAEDRRDPRQHQPGLPRLRAGIRAQPVRLRGADHRARLQVLRLRRAYCAKSARRLDRCAPGSLHAARVPALRTVITFGCAMAGAYGWDDVLAQGDGVSPEELARVQQEQQFDDPINIQYTSGTTGFPKGVTLSHHSILNNGYFIGNYMRFSPAGPPLHPRPLLSLLRHGAGQSRLRHARRDDGHPRPWLRPRRARWRRSRRSAAPPSMACRPCSSPNWRCRSSTRFDLSTLRTGIMAGSPCPVEVMKQVNTRMNMTRRDDLLRHDRDRARLLPEHDGRPARQARQHGRARPSARRVQDHRPRDGRGRAARHDGRTPLARVHRHARLLEQPGGDARRRSTRAAGCTPATSRRWTTRATSTSSAARRT